jgi:hypothetical protein
MTSGVTISGAISGGTTYTVDFNTAATKACNPTVAYRFGNPLIVLDTPIISTQTLGENTLAVNIGFVTNAFDITFDLYDGPGTFSFKTPSTDYEKIVHLTNYVKGVKTLTLNGQAFTGQIENLHVTWEHGKKNLAEGCTLTFRLSKDIGTSA